MAAPRGGAPRGGGNPYDVHQGNPLGQPCDPMDDQFGPKHAGKRHEQMDAALRLLHGDITLCTVAWAGLILALANTIFGIVYMDFTLFQRCFAFLAVVFLCCASFNLVEVALPSIQTQRYFQALPDAQNFDLHRYENFMLKGAEFVGGHIGYRIQVFVAFVLAVLCVSCGVFVMPNVTGQADGPSLTPEKLALLVGSAFMLFASINLASVLRDKFHADTLEELFESVEVDISVTTSERALSLAHDTQRLRQLFFVCSLVLAAISTLYVLFAFDIDKAHLGFVIPGYFFMIVSLAYLSMSIEGQGPTAALGSGHAAFWPVLGIFLVAVGLTGYGLAIMLLQWQEKHAILLSILFTLFSVFILVQARYKCQRIDRYSEQVKWYSAQELATADTR